MCDLPNIAVTPPYKPVTTSHHLPRRTWKTALEKAVVRVAGREGEWGVRWLRA